MCSCAVMAFFPGASNQDRMLPSGSPRIGWNLVLSSGYDKLIWISKWQSQYWKSLLQWSGEMQHLSTRIGSSESGQDWYWSSRKECWICPHVLRGRSDVSGIVVSYYSLHLFGWVLRLRVLEEQHLERYFPKEPAEKYYRKSLRAWWKLNNTQYWDPPWNITSITSRSPFQKGLDVLDSRYMH